MSDPTSSATAAAAPTLRRGNYFGLGTYLGLAGALLAMIALFSALSSHFLSYGTFLAIANQIPDLVVLAVGMTFILIVGGIDLSVGSVLALAASAVSLATLGWGWGVLPAAMLGMACATLAGCVTGSITVAWRIPSFIVSLGVLEMARGLAYQMTDSRTAYIGDAYAWLSNPLAFGISPAFVIALLVMFAAQAVLTRTVFGRYLIGIGTNEEAVRFQRLRLPGLGAPRRAAQGGRAAGADAQCRVGPGLGCQRRGLLSIPLEQERIAAGRQLLVHHQRAG